MSVTNLLSNQESETLKEIQKKIERGHFDISNTTAFPMEVGKLYPIFTTKTLPGAYYKINGAALLRQLQPMLVPQMSRFILCTAWYWVDYRYAYPKIARFFINQSSSDLLELPYMYDNVESANPDNETYKLHELTKEKFQRIAGKDLEDSDLQNDIRTYLGFTKEQSTEKIDCMPIWAYNSIFANFYMPLDRISEEKYNYYFPLDPHDIEMRDGANWKYNHKSTFEESYFGLKYHTIRDDYFSCTYPKPMRGNAPTLTLKFDSNTLKLSSDALDLRYKWFGGGTVNADQKIIPGSGSNAYDAGQDLPLTIQSNAPAHGIVSYRRFGVNESEFNIIDNDLKVDLTQQELRTLSALTVWKETSMLAKPTLKDYARVHYAQKIGESSLEAPIFIGGTSQTIQVNEIQQNSQTSETSPLGTTGATTFSNSSEYVGEFFSKWFGCLMGIAYIIPDYVYEPAIPKMWQERTVEEWFSPEFSHLSMQPVLNKELYVSQDDEWNNEVLGYNGQYDNYRMSQNTVAGLLLSDYEDINIFSQTRRFTNSNKPEITEEYLRADKAFNKSVFAVPSMPPFIVQFGNFVDSVLPIPQVATPKE